VGRGKVTKAKAAHRQWASFPWLQPDKPASKLSTGLVGLQVICTVDDLGTAGKSMGRH
jgi:hypothetical protein